ncbi:hypothetical protein, partial [Bacteroides fragilis]|uniref:hypothetical protein n=1 Tax=Bacteroides fragilis TaxID=817 RepID=UPI003313FF4F
NISSVQDVENLLTVIFSYTYIISIDGSKFTCTTCIVYQFFKELFFSIALRFKSGCKGKRFILKHQMFLEVFFKMFFRSVLWLS